MEQFYTILAILIAGVSLTIATISLFVAVRRPTRADLLFPAMGLALTIFFLLPPVGFILLDIAPYPASILIKRIFIFSYYGIAPWFILAYTGYPRRGLAYLTTTIVVVCYFIMAFTTEDRPKPVWSMIAVIGFACVFIQGVIGIVWQYRHCDRKSANWMSVALSFYGVLLIVTAVNQLTNGAVASALNMKLFFPMHFNSLLFMLIIGARLASASIENYRLELNLRLSEERWRSFMMNVPVIVVELNESGRPLFINTFGLKLLGRENPSDFLQSNWLNYLNPADVQRMKGLYAEMFKGGTFVPAFQNTLRDKQGVEHLISWVNFATHNAEGRVVSVVSIGKDITDEYSAQHLVGKLQMELQKEKIALDAPPSHNENDIVGSSKSLQYALTKARQVAPGQTPVLLEGETGVGKELFAQLVQRNSSRKNEAFVKVNCGALPKELIETELFGHEKGAFTSAIQSRKGRFELADGGTIFLDEIGELPLDMQPKLLRVLQNGEFDRIGGQKTVKVDVRIVAATNRNLALEVQEGRFRADLYYRLNVFPITIPPLRNRRDDLPELINYFIIRKCQKHNKSLEQISRANLQRLIDYAWPGNIRELKNVIERSVIASAGKELSFEWWETEAEEVPPGNHALADVERDHILAVMERCNWKINGENGAAEILAMHPSTLRSKMKKLGIERPDSKGMS